MNVVVAMEMKHSIQEGDARAFAPFDGIARTLLPYGTDGADGAHDVTHLQRVWRNVVRIVEREGGDMVILVAAAILHDCVHVPKSSPLRSQASRMAADRARDILHDLGWDHVRIEAVHHAIVAHSYSAGVPPETLEARILQDADRLDALGMIGVARCLLVSGSIGRGLYDPDDPIAERRPLDDGRFTIDHFRTKLLGLREGMRTGTGAEMAEERHSRVVRFLDEFLSEIR